MKIPKRDCYELNRILSSSGRASLQQIQNDNKKMICTVRTVDNTKEWYGMKLRFVISVSTIKI